jgi:SAM-dependent methyltransferase
MRYFHNIPLAVSLISHWEGIYQDYLKEKVHPALRSDNILAEFKDLVETSDFSEKVALDIGCGRGIYLKYLEDRGFTVNGIDSSSTAIALCKSILSNTAHLVLADMFDYDIPKNEFDLIFSIAALYHGRKKEVNDLVTKIISSSRPNAKIFITLPVYPEKNIWALRKKIGNEIKRFISVGLPNWRAFKALKAFVNKKDWQNPCLWTKDGERLPLAGPEKGLFHSYYKREELDNLFSDCLTYSAERKGEEWFIKAIARGME